VESVAPKTWGGAKPLSQATTFCPFRAFKTASDKPSKLINCVLSRTSRAYFFDRLIDFVFKLGLRAARHCDFPMERCHARSAFRRQGLREKG
jgi:hypothetical protein